MSRQSKTNSGAPPVIGPKHPWQGTHTLHLVRELNERCLSVLTELALSEECSDADIISMHRDLWRVLDALGRSRAAQIPVLLLDLYFQTDDWWRWARSHRSGQWRGVVQLNCLPAKIAGELMRETLMLAWHAARTNHGAASLLIGMSQSVAVTISSFGLKDIEHIAATHSRYLHLRWAAVPVFWRNLLAAAHSGDSEALHQVHLHSLQLLGSELIPSHV